MLSVGRDAYWRRKCLVYRLVESVIELGDARCLSPAAQEVVRLRVVAAPEAGRVRTYGQAAEMFGVTQRSVGTWWRKYQAAGRDALAAPVKTRSGPGELISDADCATLFQAMADPGMVAVIPQRRRCARMLFEL